MIKLRTLVLAALLIFPALAEQAPQDSLLKVYTTRKGEAGTALGTGFYISTNGQVATAYHVIQGASTLDVFSKFGQCSEPKLVAFDADSDIAILSVNSMSCGIVTPLQVVDVPLGLLALKGRAYGFPDGKPAFSVEVGFTKDGTMLGRQFFAPGGSEIFALDSTQIIPIDGTIGRGMSGGPLMIDGKVIGIISGSQAPQGRTFGWAMPASALRLLTPSTETFQNSPPLRMLRSGMNSPLLKIGVTAERIEKLNAFREILEQGESIARHALELAALFPEKSASSLNACRSAKNSDAMATALEAMLEDLKEVTQSINSLGEILNTFYDKLVVPVGRALAEEIDSMNEEQTMRSMAMSSSNIEGERDSTAALNEALANGAARQTAATNSKTALSSALKSTTAAQSEGCVQVLVSHAELLQASAAALDVEMRLAKYKVGALQQFVDLKSRQITFESPER